MFPVTNQNAKEGKDNLKIHVAVDIKKKKIVSFDVTSEEVHDCTMLKKLVDNASENNDVKRVIADGAYDSKENFRYLFHNRIEAAVWITGRRIYRTFYNG